MKVTYISNPMMVKASNASEFRAIVQELTGQHSDFPSWDDSANVTASGEANKVPTQGIPYTVRIDAENVKDELSDAFSSFDFNDTFSWREVYDCLSGFQSQCVFV